MLLRKASLSRVLPLLTFSLLSCSANTGSGGGPICEAVGIAGECIAYTGTDLDSAECQTLGGIPQTGTCSTTFEAFVGSCALTSKTHYFYSAGTNAFYSESTAQTRCGTLGGTFTNPTGASSGGTVHGSCSNMSGVPDECLEFVDGSGTWTSTLMQSNCSTLSGTFSTGGCSSTSRVGRCLLGNGSPAEQLRHYYSPTFNAGTAEAGCNIGGGTFIAN